jgi:hypothetical protein
MKSTQYTIRNIPNHVDKVLRARAQKQGKSFNQTVLEVLERGIGVGKKPELYHDLDWFIGQKMIDKKAYSKAQRWLDSLPKDL